MAIGVSAAEVLPAWLEVGKDDVLPEAVQALYNTLAPEIGRVCERARKRMGAGYVSYLRGLREAHTALAKDGKFKEWCEAYGLKYGTVCNQLSQESKLAVNDSLTGRSLDPAVKPAHLAVRFADATERSDMIAYLREVLKELGVKDADDWKQAVLYLFNYWHEHEHPKEAAA